MMPAEDAWEAVSLDEAGNWSNGATIEARAALESASDFLAAARFRHCSVRTGVHL
jgi:hypothetical protein